MAPTTFTPEARGKLYHFLSKVFPPARRRRIGIRLLLVGGEKQRRLRDRFLEVTGRLDLDGETIADELRNLILKAPEQQLLGLLKLMLEVEAQEHAGPARGAAAASVLSKGIDDFLERIGVAGLDATIAAIGAPSRDVISRLVECDPLDAAIGPQERVAIHYFLQEEFPPAVHNWWANGDVGGAAQRALEEQLRKTLNVLQLARGRNIAEILQKFVTEAGSPRQLLVLLEQMPRVHGYTLHCLGRSKHEEETGMAALRGRVVALLGKFDIEMTFDTEGHLVESVLDTTPKALRALPDDVALLRSLQVAMNTGSMVSVISLDMDGLKALNDTLGHPKADEVIGNLATVISHAVAGKGKLFRSHKAGDEFSIALPNFDAQEAIATAERVRRAVDAAKLGGGVPVTVSVGVATSAPGTAAEDLIQHADDAVYASKNTGKNRVTAWPLDPEMAVAVMKKREAVRG